MPNTFQNSALVVVAHGDRDGEAKRVLVELVSELQMRHTQRRVEAAFLLAVPASMHLPHVIEMLLEEGYRRITVMPWFLFAGPHVRKDIPEFLQSVRDQHADLELTLLEPLGSDPILMDLLEARLAQV